MFKLGVEQTSDWELFFVCTPGAFIVFPSIDVAFEHCAIARCRMNESTWICACAVLLEGTVVAHRLARGQVPERVPWVSGT